MFKKKSNVNNVGALASVGNIDKSLRKKINILIGIIIILILGLSINSYYIWKIVSTFGSL